MASLWTTGPRAPWHWRYYFPHYHWKQDYTPFRPPQLHDVPKTENPWLSWDLLSPQQNPNDDRDRREPLNTVNNRTFRNLDPEETKARAEALAGHESPWNDSYGPSSPGYGPEAADEALGLWLTHDPEGGIIPPSAASQSGEQMYLDSQRTAVLSEQRAEIERGDRGQVYDIPELRWVRRNDLMCANRRVPCMEGLRQRDDKPQRYGFNLEAEYEMNEWDGYSSEKWSEHCPHFLADTAHPDAYRHDIKACAWEEKCLNFRLDVMDIWECRDLRSPKEEQRIDWMEAINDKPVLTGIGRPDLEDRRYYVCRHHLEASRRYFQPRKILDAMRFGTCKPCRSALLKQYPNGVNTCSCERTMNRWMCRLDFRDALTHLIERFIWRISRRGPWGGVPGPHPEPGKYRLYTRPADEPCHAYEDNGSNMEDWKYDFLEDPGSFRKVVYENHPCGLGCGRLRQRQSEVVDCRSCGGLIVSPKASNVDRAIFEPRLELRSGRKILRAIPATLSPSAKSCRKHQKRSEQDGVDRPKSASDISDFPKPPLRSPDRSPSLSDVPFSILAGILDPDADDTNPGVAFETIEEPGLMPTINTHEPARRLHIVQDWLSEVERSPQERIQSEGVSDRDQQPLDFEIYDEENLKNHSETQTQEGDKGQSGRDSQVEVKQESPSDHVPETHPLEAVTETSVRTSHAGSGYEGEVEGEEEEEDEESAEEDSEAETEVEERDGKRDDDDDNDERGGGGHGGWHGGSNGGGNNNDRNGPDGDSSLPDDEEERRRRARSNTPEPDARLPSPPITGQGVSLTQLHFTPPRTSDPGEITGPIRHQFGSDILDDSDRHNRASMDSHRSEGDQSHFCSGYPAGQVADRYQINSFAPSQGLKRSWNEAEAGHEVIDRARLHDFHGSPLTQIDLHPLSKRICRVSVGDDNEGNGQAGTGGKGDGYSRYLGWPFLSTVRRLLL